MVKKYSNDLHGARFGRLCPVEIFENKKGVAYWLCFCDCGNKKVVNFYHLINNKIKSCGCLRKETTKACRFKDLTGLRFDRLLVKRQVENIGRRTAWLCICDCGREKTIISEFLTSKADRIKSCGCLRDDPETLKRKNGNHSTSESCAWILYKTYRHNAELRHRDFCLEFEEFKNITSQNCFYCGIIPSQKTSKTKKGAAYIYNGIDRKDNSLGYILENCIPCCSGCNTSKNVRSYEDFQNWINRIVEFKMKESNQSRNNLSGIV